MGRFGGARAFASTVLLLAGVAPLAALWPNPADADSILLDNQLLDRSGESTRQQSPEVTKLPVSACTTCHDVTRVFSHPVGVAPSADVPDNLPLLNGLITCTTCHANDSGQEHSRAGSGQGVRFQGDRTVAQLCSACHKRSHFDRASAHAMATLRAHYECDATRMDHGIVGSGSSDGVEFDKETSECMSCHDGSIVTSGGHGARSSGSLGIGVSHPIGVTYRMNRGLSLRSPRSLDPSVQLFDGRIGCNSCHNPYAEEANLLVRSNQGSALCLSCHEQ